MKPILVGAAAFGCVTGPSGAGENGNPRQETQTGRTQGRAAGAGPRLGAALLGITGKRLGQRLNRHLALQLGVGGLIHLTHAAFADLRGDFIRTEAGAGLQGQVADYYGSWGVWEAITPL